MKYLDHQPFLRLSIALLIWINACFYAYGQQNTAWDDTRQKDWPAEALPVEIVSSADGKIQKGYFYRAPGDQPRPLIVSLHTWSGDYRQKDTLIHFCLERGYHYIHPDFRGPNHTREAMGSELVISDIDDAIAYSLKNANVDLENIHVHGVSGGGHATVLAYMKSRHPIRTFTAYVGIYNLVDWYYESLGRAQKYAGDIAASTTGDRNRIDLEEARRRSPMFMEVPPQRSRSKLFLYCGVHDGYIGSVPVTQTLHLYNKVVRHFDPRAIGALIPGEVMEHLLRERSLPGFPDQGTYLGRKIIYRNQYRDLVSVTVFEGGHEMPQGDVLAHVPARRILAIGDSNGAMAEGWVDQLQKLRPSDQIVNTCISGNTIGFDNNGQARLNTLKNLDRYLEQAQGRIDAVIILLGTNDAKAEFDSRLAEVPANLEKLIGRIKQAGISERQILVASPPPYGRDEQLLPKYHGAARRVKALREKFAVVARNQGVHFIDLQRPLDAVFPYLSHDGVHLTREGQVIVARVLSEALDKTSPSKMQD